MNSRDSAALDRYITGNYGEDQFSRPLARPRKRETDGKYAHEGNLERLCVCGHTLGFHGAGSPADCLFYSFPAVERAGKPGEQKPDCGCQKFRLPRKAVRTQGQ